MTTAAAVVVISGLGIEGYTLALQILLERDVCGLLVVDVVVQKRLDRVPENLLACGRALAQELLRTPATFAADQHEPIPCRRWPHEDRIVGDLGGVA